MRRIAKFIIFTWMAFLTSLGYANTFNFTPIGSLPTSVVAGQTVSALYNVTSVGNFPVGQYHTILALLSIPSFVTQDQTVPNACGVLPISPAGCTLKLDIVGPVSGPVKICDDWKGGPGLNCYIPSNSNFFLNVGTNFAPALTVSPLLTFLQGGQSQIFTVVNTSTTATATGITITIPAGVLGQLASVINGCTSPLAPLGTCIITITAVASPSAQSGIASIQGTNTLLPNPTVSITTGAAPALTVSPPATILGPGDSQIFTVINTSTTTPATNVTLAIPANVLAQLASVGSCPSIAASGSCTITITAKGSVTAQSGIASVQGDNTAAPAPTVSITTGAAPALTVSPPATILGPNGSQQFIVTNTSTNITAQGVTMTIPANVQAQLTSIPIYNGCSSIIPLGTCTITITAIASPSAQSGVASVQGTNTAGPAPTVAITTGAAPTLTVSPPSTILGGGDSQQFTVTNTGTITANNITMTIPANVQGQLTGAPVYSGCGSIAPSGTCTITINAVASPTAQSGTASVQGTNTAAPAPTVAITTGAAPTLTVSPSSANIPFNGTQVFTVTNTGTITANNITMTIPANVQGQLVGLPIYSGGCTALAPASSACTITIQAVAAPSSQSGVATVQGTNTAAPSPQVSIFVLPVCTVLGASTVTSTGATSINGGVCVAPGTAITGFPPGQVSPPGNIHPGDAIANADHNDAVTLYNTIAGLTCGLGNNLSGQDLGGMTLSSGVYCFNTAATLAAGSTLTLNGSVTDKFYIQIGTTLTTGAAANVVLTGGAVPGNVYWQIGSSATFGANNFFKGQVIALTSQTIGAGMNLNGRLWVLNAAITMDTDTVGP